MDKINGLNVVLSVYDIFRQEGNLVRYNLIYSGKTVMQ